MIVLFRRRIRRENRLTSSQILKFPLILREITFHTCFLSSFSGIVISERRIRYASINPSAVRHLKRNATFEGRNCL